MPIKITQLFTHSEMFSLSFVPLMQKIVPKYSLTLFLKNINSNKVFAITTKATYNRNLVAFQPLLYPLQLRIYHHDIKAPSFKDYRRPLARDKFKRGKDTIDQRQVFTYTIELVSLVGLLYGTKAHALHYIMCLAATKDVLALAKIEIKLSDIPEGVNMTYKWRGKPLFVWHRTPDDISKAVSTPLSELRHPETDEARTKNPKFLVIIGICTHLGCVPLPPRTGDWGGYYCPCHGSHFDTSGRTRKGPAMLNMEVPPHTYLDENTLIVG